MKGTILLLLTASFIHSHAQYLKPGKWRGEIHYSHEKIPFSFDVSYPGGEIPQLTLINGEERRIIKDVRWENDTIVVRLTPFDVSIKAKATATTMRGTYEKHYRDFSFPFVAEFGKPRMMKKSVKPSPPLEDRWDMTFDPETSNSSKAVGLFRQIGPIVSGTVMTKVSDYRYFEGIMDGDSIKLSCFDGAHAFLIRGKKTDGKWTGEMIYDENQIEPWIATPDPSIELEDPFDLVKLTPGEHRPYYDLLAAGSGRNVIDATKYEGKVLVIQLFGTWCPNSQDQTAYLVEWYKNNKDRDVSIIASSYEANYSQEYGLERIESYKSDNDIPYEVVLGGRLSKSAAAMPFPFMTTIDAFPTLVIVDKQGFARYVHSYFNGPATGKYFKEFDQRFNEIMDELLQE